MSSGVISVLYYTCRSRGSPALWTWRGWGGGGGGVFGGGGGPGGEGWEGLFVPILTCDRPVRRKVFRSVSN